MKVDVFDYNLDKSLIATDPANPRDSSKLLDLSDGENVKDRHFYDLPDVLHEGDVLVFNNTKVIPAKLYAKRANASLELTLYHPEDELIWWAFIKNSKRLKQGDVIDFYNEQIDCQNSEFKAKVIEKRGEDGVLIEFLCQKEKLEENLKLFGYMPLPPYIKREKLEKRNDEENYQTIYAKHKGAVAAPTAGLHFTPEVMKKLEEKGVECLFVTLHVGAGTFLPVKVEDTKDHKMHSEFGIITRETADKINEAKKQGRRIIAVGTTSLRLMESAADDTGIIYPFKGETDIFITPGYKFKIIDMIITNFHLPKSTLFMLICAIAGTEKMQKVYEYAISKKYRFYSYGDSSILKCVNKI